MKKKLIGMTVAAAAMTVMMSFSAFAGWEQDSTGWKYIRDDGSQVWSGWFTDPADGSIYYIDPDGYMMSETRVSGYWLGADGRRIDKTQEEIDREAARAEREANKPAPSQSASQVAEATQAAKRGTAAATTNRRAYVAEMKVFMDKYYIDTAKILTNQSLRSGSTLDNIQQTYRFSLADQGDVISTTLWTVTLKNSINYQPQTADISYNRGLLGEDADVPKFDALFKNMVVAALGDTTGQQVYNNIFEQLGNGIYQFEFDGNTDSGNYYTLSCGNGTVKIQITCSENTGTQTSEEAGDTANTENTETAGNTEAVQETPSSSVITVGADNSTDEDAE